MCVGMTTRGLWDASSGGSGEGCGARTVRRLRTGLGTFASDRAGVFAYGHTGRGVFWVRVRFDGEDWHTLQTLPTPDPPGGRDRFWILPAQGDCPLVTVQAIGGSGQVVDEHRAGPAPGVAPGTPDPYAACRSG
jgi:hypothetical protein